MLFTRHPLPRLLLLGAVVVAFSSEAEAQRFYRRRAMVMTPPAVGVGVSPGGGVSVRTPFYSFDRAPGVYPYSPGSFYSRYGWPGVSVRVQTPGAPTLSTNAPTRANGEYDPAPGDGQYSAPTTAGYNLVPNYQPTSATRAGLEGELAMAHAGLNDKLDMFNGGAGWQKYFALGQDELADPAKTEKLLRRMDSVATDPKFEAVASLDEFRRVHELLQIIASEDANPQPPVQLGAPPATEEVEAIPAPAPQTKPAPATGVQPPPEPQPPAAAPQPPVRQSGERSVLKED